MGRNYQDRLYAYTDYEGDSLELWDEVEDLVVRNVHARTQGLAAVRIPKDHIRGLHAVLTAWLGEDN